ncbi:hypothetical protein C482_11435 [Natrialba chahannaoensis JCM 10990]|uniref:Uncharacterized protein n=1 Tax=Natrialba chahannaoensis JCM 10990 TaxID=1227492 RepID=M0AL85_9EURY|nr:hypothetical protein C482_11435 [Natrialba chahannaoensis JCM 10990]
MAGATAGVGGCLTGTDDAEPKRLLYLMLTNNRVQEQRIEVHLDIGDERVSETVYKFPPFGSEESAIPGTTPPSQYMVVPDETEPETKHGLRVRYPETDTWVEAEFGAVETKQFAVWVTMWQPQEPSVETEVFVADDSERNEADDAAGMTLAEGEAFRDSFLERQADRDYAVGSE